MTTASCDHADLYVTGGDDEFIFEKCPTCGHENKFPLALFPTFNLTTALRSLIAEWRGHDWTLGLNDVRLNEGKEAGLDKAADQLERLLDGAVE